MKPGDIVAVENDPDLYMVNVVRLAASDTPPGLRWVSLSRIEGGRVHARSAQRDVLDYRLRYVGTMCSRHGEQHPCDDCAGVA